MAKKILIVEDDPVARHVLHSTLKGADFETLIAMDAMTALPLAQKNTPDLIILDLGLPAGGGYTFLQRLKTFPALAVIPIIVVSGLDRAANEAKAIAVGASAYLQKPAKPEELIETVKKVIGG